MDMSRATPRYQIVGQLEEMRQSTQWLLSGVFDEDLARTHDPVMGPVIRDHLLRRQLFCGSGAQDRLQVSGSSSGRALWLRNPHARDATYAWS